MTPKSLHRIATIPASVAALGLPSLAAAHGLHAEGATMLSGAVHPFSGLDHLLVLLATALWSTQAGPAGHRSTLALFLASLLAGLASGVALRSVGIVQPGIAWLESGLAASVMAAGLMLAFAPRLSTATGAALVTALSLLHGLAHGIESPAGDAAPWAIGVIGGSAALLFAGRWVGLQLHGPAGRSGLRVAGAVSALAGTLLLA